MLVAAEFVHAGEGRDVGLAGHSRGQDELFRAQHHRFAVPLDVDRPFFAGLVEAGALGLSAWPVVELHDLGVGLKPVGDLVLGREHRPVVRELQVRHVVVPHGVVQAERLVPATPLVTRAGALVDDDRGHTELPEPRREPDAGLAAADDQHVRLLGNSQFLGLVLAILQPGGPVSAHAVLGAYRTAQAFRLLIALELIEGGEQGPALAAAQPHVTVSPARRGLEVDPGLGDAVGLRGFLAVGDRPAGGLRL